ncbi:hypothetical protein D3C86_1586630 [compost metagenome]
MNSSAISKSFASSMPSPIKDTIKIGVSDGSNFLITGSSTSSGNFGFAIFTLSRTCCSAYFESMLELNSTITCETPSKLFEVKRLIPEMVLTSSSIGRLTKVSISEGPAP